MNYYIQDENEKIVLFDTNLETLQNTLIFMPQYQGLEILETEREIIELNNEFMFKDEHTEEITQIREAKFNEEFFNTSLGYVRRTVNMKDGSTVDFLTGILPLLQAGVPIITYNKPDFTEAELPTQNTGVIVTEDFINECKQQVLTDFYGAVSGL